MGLVLVSRCLASRIDDSYKALKINTKEQLKVLLDSSPDRWIVGPAGSGKTCLLMEKVFILAKEIISKVLDQKILVVCYNKPLSLMISRTIEHELKAVYDLQDKDQSEDPGSVVDVKTFDKILRDINGLFRKEDGENRVAMALEKLQRGTSSVRPSYDHIFVDEGQDLYHAQWPRLLKMMLKNSSVHPAVEDDDLNPRYFWVFYDSNQHLHLSKEKTVPTHSDELKNSHRLHQVLRNTKNVFEQANKYFEPLLKTSLPVGVYHREVGLEIKWDDSLQSEETISDTKQEQSIVEHVKYLERNDVENGDICVLVRDETTRQSIISNLQGVGIVCQNAEELWTEVNNNKVVVESIRRFKGLESKVVILYNPPFAAERKTRELLYTAISRCLCYLIVISTKQGCESLQSEAGLVSGILGTFPKPSQLLTSEPVDLESTSVAFPVKRQFQDDDNSSFNQLYKRLKELEGDNGRHLLGPGRSVVDDSVRDSECKKLLPSLWKHLQLFSQYKDVTQPALRKIVALLEYRVLQKSNNGNYVGNMETKKQEIDTSTQKKEMDVDVAGALGLH